MNNKTNESVEQIMFKKLIALVLSATMLLGLGTTAFASEQSLITTIESNDAVVIVKEITDEGITLATNDKATGLLTVEKYDSSMSNLISTQIINLKAIESSQMVQSAFRWGNGDEYQHTITNYEYDLWYGDPNEWKIRRDSSVRWIDESPSNEDNLYNYADKVEDVNTAEWAIVTAIGGTAAATAIVAFLSGGTAAGVAAAGGGTAIATAFAVLNGACNKADLAWNKI